MQGFVLVTFLYDSLRATGRSLQAKAITLPLTDSRSPLDMRMKTTIDLEMEQGKKNGWTLVSLASTLVPKLVGSDAEKVPMLLFVVMGVKGTDRKCETQLVPAWTHGLEPEHRISEAIALMAELSKGKGYRPIGHTATFVV